MIFTKFPLAKQIWGKPANFAKNVEINIFRNISRKEYELSVGNARMYQHFFTLFYSWKMFEFSASFMIRATSIEGISGAIIMLNFVNFIFPINRR